ncbi:SPOR domain-containing protein [Leucothrix pacifica]|uniref:SPOR domain-containing protein n=1 Tax=Leucothrix pacifica TaxID=1247513 RepID=A0A317CAE4_9GAMM|nr:SPOR domain-containing protein [Leucothrix pacifica]PWQ93042.1 hypothetical protein DKW60_18320 [Leucothrix pacifica]
MIIRNTLTLCLAVGVLTGCSQIADINPLSQVSQSIQSVTKLGSQSDDSYSDGETADLVVPPSLALPADVQRTQQIQQATQQRQQQQQALSSNKNYYVVVGTYPDSEQAMDMFVRLSSIGLPNATMESRATKTGKSLHMVRLGPFKRQEQIDKVKDSLVSDGLSQFKVVES